VAYFYGSSRLGELTIHRDSSTTWNRHYYRYKGNRHYELSNHLGNVLAVVTDRKMAQDTTHDLTTTPQYYLPDVYSVQNYYPFGQNIPKWSTSASNDPTRYRFGFNDKENDNEWVKQDYGMRIYDQRVGRFLSVDPLREKYPWNSTYAFAENRPIDGKDLDGLEWDKATDSNGNTKISTNINFTIDPDLKFSEKQIESYKSALSEQLNSTLKKSFGENYSGQVTFDGGVESRQVIPLLYISANKPKPGEKISIAGMTVNQNSLVNIYHKDGTIKSPEEIAEDGIHELFHTLRLGHPFETTQGPDTKLIRLEGSSYETTQTTDPKIIYNIMSYSIIKINGQNAENSQMVLLTKDQLKMILNEIDLQKNGAGTAKRKDYNDYWLNIPGEDVLQKK
jgi:RHS repeat-associated protein